MWNLFSSVELATMTVDFTNELSWLTTGLIALVVLSVAAIAFTAWDGRKDERLLHDMMEDISYREAA